MSTVKVYCPNHGLIKTIEMDCMWKGRPPMPEIEDAFCPICGTTTDIVRSESYRKSWTLKSHRSDEHFGMEIADDGTVTRIIR